MRNKIIILALVVLAAVAGVRFSSIADDTLPVLHTQAPAPDFTLNDFDGGTFRLADQQGKIVVLEWTNPDCPFVQRVYREAVMTAIQSRWAKPEIVWKTINSSNYTSSEQNQEWVKTYRLPSAILDDRKGTVGKMYGAKTTPQLFVIDKAGVLAYQGALDSDAYGDQGPGRIAYLDLALQALSAGDPVKHASTKAYGCSVKYKWGA